MTMLDAIPIFQGQDFYVPHFQVKLRDRPLGRDVVHDIVQVTYKDNIEEIDSFEITINNWDAETRSFKYLDQDLFDPGHKVELQMGYYGKDRLRLMVTGEITSLSPNFPASGQPTLTISGLNLLHRFRDSKATEAYEGRTDSQIAKQIEQRLGLEIRIDQNAAEHEVEYPYILQDNAFDVIFLMERARRIGYDLVVEEIGGEGLPPQSRLYFGPSVNLRKVTYELVYGRSLTQMDVDLDTSNQVSKVSVQGWDAEKKQPIKYTASRDEIRTRGVGEAGGQAAIDKSFARRSETITTVPVSSPQEARTLATETLERIAKEMLKGKGATVGLPDLRAGSIVKIGGLGKRYSGRYFVTATTHTIGDSGYTTQFECRREEI
jgi:phage protein D